MRVTQSMVVRTALNDINQQRLLLAKTQERAFGLEINRPSDDPVGASAALLLRAGIDATKQYQENATQSLNRVSTIEAALGGTMDILIQALETATEGASGTGSAETRAILALEVERLHDELVAQANTQSGQAFVFAGFETDSPPFVSSGPFVDTDPSPTVSYSGDQNEAQTPIDDQATATTTLNGARIFQGDADGDGIVDAGSVDLFAVLGDLRDALRTNNEVDVAAALTEINDAIDQVSLERAKVGMTETKITDLQDRLSGRLVDLEISRGELEFSDPVRVLSDLLSQEAALQAMLATTSRLIQPSLLDFLR